MDQAVLTLAQGAAEVYLAAMGLKMQKKGSGVALLLGLLLVGDAGAGPLEEKYEEAKRLAQGARETDKAADYAAAGKAFEEVVKQRTQAKLPVAHVLLSAANQYRRAGQMGKARGLYERCLKERGASAEIVKGAQEGLRQVQAQAVERSGAGGSGAGGGRRGDRGGAREALAKGTLAGPAGPAEPGAGGAAAVRGAGAAGQAEKAPMQEAELPSEAELAQGPRVEQLPAGVGRLPETAERAEMVPIPAGTFLMGSPAGEEGRSDDETQHRVRISRGYWMGKTEVTQGQWKAVMGTDPSYFKGSELPVERVSWLDAVAYCNKLSEKEGLKACYRVEGQHVTWTEGLKCQGYRLSTEAEWEYAARGGRIFKFSGGKDPADVAWYVGNSERRTHPVGTKRGNGWGLHDMSGNVWEWVWDVYKEYDLRKDVDPIGPLTGSIRVDRGGSFGDAPILLRVARRGWGSPGGAGRYLGLRLSRSLP